MDKSDDTGADKKEIRSDGFSCPFASVSDKSLEVAHILLANLSNRMRSGAMKSHTTDDELRSVNLVIAVIKQEQTLREEELTIFGDHDHSVTGTTSGEGQNDGR